MITEESGKKQGTTEVFEVGGLLSPDDRLLCTQIITRIPPWNQRAQSLLLVDDGASFEIAGEITGLRATQVKYWVDHFRKHGSNIFPESILVVSESLPEASESTSIQDEIAPAENQVEIKKDKLPEKTKNDKGKGSKKKKRNLKKKKGKGKKKGK